ncbi:hypothetical protein [Paraglaciecola sp. 2405UD69-4]|uniref:hypothetical protein n=1 Tax=Paraglaciecola sp. 2405UD69-4 TaxID=3391836 RepID=UPI0039C98902
MKKLSLTHSLDWLMALCSLAGFLAVLQTFIIGKHYIIPTILLTLTVLMGNLAWYGLKQVKWANYVNFWLGFILTNHLFFAVFWAKTPREILGAAFVPAAISLTLIMLIFTVFYGRKNQLFSR